MLNGNSPVFIIQHYKVVNAKKVKGETITQAGKQKQLDDINDYINLGGKKLNFLEDTKKWKDLIKTKKIPDGLPIPFTLNEYMGFVNVQEQDIYSNTIDFEAGVKYNRQRKASLSLQIQYDIDNLIANVLAQTIAYLWENCEPSNYNISYFNITTSLINGTLGNFEKLVDNKSNLGVLNLTFDRGDDFSITLEKEQNKKAVGGKTMNMINRKKGTIDKV